MHAFVLDGEVARVVSSPDELARAHADGQRLWLDLDARTPEGERFLEVLRIHPLSVEDLWEDRELPKVDDYGDFVHIIIHSVHDPDALDAFSLEELDVLVGRNFVVTHTHHPNACGVQVLRTDLTKVARLLKRGPAFFAHAVLDRLADDYLPLIDKVDAAVAALEVEVLDEGADDTTAVMHRLLRLKRAMQTLRRTSIRQRDMLLRLSRAEFDEIPKEAMPFYRDVYDHFAQVTELVESYRELLANLLDAHFSVQSNRMNEIMKRLTLISTIMLPLTLIAGIYGMNFETMPELRWAWGYPTALGAMAVVGVGIYVYFKRKGWVLSPRRGSSARPSPCLRTRCRGRSGTAGTRAGSGSTTSPS